jgi:acetolactate synthase small subunit
MSAADALSPEQEVEHLLSIYRERWVDLSATEALIIQLEARAKDMRAKQRQLANKIAMVGQVRTEERP